MIYLIEKQRKINHFHFHLGNGVNVIELFVYLSDWFIRRLKGEGVKGKAERVKRVTGEGLKA